MCKFYNGDLISLRTNMISHCISDKKGYMKDLFTSSYNHKLTIFNFESIAYRKVEDQ